MFTPSYLTNMLFDRAFETHYSRILSCFGIGAWIWFMDQPTFPTFWLSSPHFSTTFWTWLGLPHPSIVGIFQCMYTHPIGATSVHFLHCAHGNEHTGTHDVVHDIFVAIIQDAEFHVGWEQLHAFLSTTFHSSCQQVDIVFIKDGIHTLADVVITDPTRMDLFCQSCITWGFVASKVVQAKKGALAINTPLIISSF
jgi:hypothetical protein